MELEAYLDEVRAWRIPKANPFMSRGYVDYRPGDMMKYFTARDECTSRGMWPIVSKSWAGQLAMWLDGRSVLEVMAGAGWVAEAMRQCGVNILATDDFSWQRGGHHKNMSSNFAVCEMDALEAVRTFQNYDTLLVSWPPYSEDFICKVCAEWRKPIIYIGEGYGGCCAVDRFFQCFKADSSAGEFELAQWSGMHDYIEIGTYDANAPVPEDAYA